jgi:hypothetical protein
MCANPLGLAMFGVSPAYFLSRFGDQFVSRQVADSLPDVRAGGF